MLPSLSSQLVFPSTVSVHALSFAPSLSQQYLFKVMLILFCSTKDFFKINMRKTHFCDTLATIGGVAWHFI